MPIHPKKKPDRERLPVTPRWAALVVDAMAARGIGLRELARELGISHATLGTVTRAETKTSPHVAAIADALGLPSPVVVVADRVKRFVDALEALEADDPAEAAQILEAAERAVALIEERRRRAMRAKKRTTPDKK